MKATTDWTARQDWLNGQIRPQHVKAAFFITLVFFIFWTGLSYFVFVQNQGNIERAIQVFVASGYRETREALFLPLLFVLSLVIIPVLVKSAYRYLRSKDLVLSLDPYPGQLGGRVGGELLLPFAFQPGLKADVHINCIEVTVSRSSRRTSRWEKIRYRTRATVAFLPVSGKTQLRFSANTQAGLTPSSIEESGSYTYWAVRVQIPEKKFDETFNIPVLDTGLSLDDAFYSDDYFASADAAAVGSHAEFPEAVARLNYLAGGFQIDYPAGREATVSTVFIVLGMIFTAVAVFMGFQVAAEWAGERTSYFAVMVMGMILLGFSLFGIGMLIGGLYMKTNRLCIEKTADKLISRRQVFGREFVKTLMLDEIHAIEKKVTSQSGQGAAARISYTLYARTLDGLKHSIGDGIPGHENADRLYDFFMNEIDLSDQQPPGGEKVKAVLPAWAQYMPVAFKVFGYLVSIAVIAAFVMDFIG